MKRIKVNRSCWVDGDSIPAGTVLEVRASVAFTLIGARCAEICDEAPTAKPKAKPEPKEEPKPEPATESAKPKAKRAKKKSGS